MFRKKQLLVALTALSATIAGVAHAIPDKNGVIHTCYTPATAGKPASPLRPVEATADCVAGEASLSFNQTGPVGPAGPAGPAGQPGPQGPPGPNDAWVEKRVLRVPPGRMVAMEQGQPLVLQIRNLEPGSYTILAKGRFHSYPARNRTEGPGTVGRYNVFAWVPYVDCELRSGDETDESSTEFPLDGRHLDELVMVVTPTLASEGAAQVHCEFKDAQGNGFGWALGLRLVATKVTGIRSAPVPVTAPTRREPTRRQSQDVHRQALRAIIREARK